MVIGGQNPGADRRMGRLKVRERLLEVFRGPVRETLQRHAFAPLASGRVGGEVQFVRSLSDRVDVVGARLLQRLGSQEADITVETGVFLRVAPHPVGDEFQGFDGLSLSCTEDCHFRNRLKPSWWASGTLFRQASWVVSGPGGGLDRALSDIATKIEKAGLPWFEAFGDLHAVYRAVLTRSRPGNALPHPWGFMYGDQLVEGFLALRLGDWSTARSDLEAVLQLENPRHLVDPHQPRQLYHHVSARIEAALDEVSHRSDVIDPSSATKP